VAQDASATVLEDASVNGNVIATDADDGATLTYALIGGATGLAFNADGSYSFDASSYDSLAQGALKVLDLSYSVSDGLESDTGALTITITGVNDAPVAQDASATVLEDASVSGNVVATDADEGAILTYTLIGGATGLTFNADGSYSFDAGSYDTLAQGALRVLELAYSVSDGLESDSGALTITITGLNDAPEAQDEAASVFEDEILNDRVVATDVDEGDTLTYALDGLAPTGLTFRSDGSYRFDASSYDFLAQDETAVLNLSYTVSDGFASDTAALVITIIGRDENNNAPVAEDAFAAVDEDDTVSGNVVATDADHGETATLTYALAEPAPLGLTFNLDGSYSFDASDYDFLSQDEELFLSVLFTASDAVSTSESATLLITVTGVNDVPVAEDASAAADEDGSVSGSVVAIDADDGEAAALIYALVDAAPEGLVFNDDGSYTFEATNYDFLSQGEELELSVLFTASDDFEASEFAELLITVTGVNDMPVAEDAFAFVNEDEIVDGIVVAIDDDEGETATLTYALVEEAPASLTFTADGSYSFDAAEFDVLRQDQTRVLSFAFTASDGHSTSAPAHLDITVTGVNDVPVAQDASNSVNEDASVSGNVIAIDADQGETATLTYALEGSAPVGLTFNPNGSYTFDASSYDVLDEGDEEVLIIPFTASDGLSASEAAVLVLTVNGRDEVNTAPVARADVATAFEDGPPVLINVLANDTDADIRDTKTVSRVQSDDGFRGSVSIALGGTAVLYSVGAAFQELGAGAFGADAFSYTVVDADGAESTAAVTVTVIGVNDNPIAVDDARSLLEDAAPLAIDVLANDTDVDALDTATVISVDRTGLQGSVEIAPDGSFVTYTVATVFQSLQVGQFAIDTFRYTMTDSAGAQSTATVSITVLGENEEVIIVNPPEPPAGAILGSPGVDEIDGGNGADVIYSLAGDDVINGGGGNDILFGGEGEDVIDGGDGDDVISGGGGADATTGGAGADIFIFYGVGESNLDDRLRPDADRIDQFTHADGDKIDLRPIDASVVLAGNNAFTVVTQFTQVAGELVLTDEEGNRGRRFLVEGDINGDGRADLVIEVRTEDGPLTAGDFFL